MWVLVGHKQVRLWRHLTHDRRQPADGDEFNCLPANMVDRQLPKSGVPGVAWASDRGKWEVAYRGRRIGFFS